MKRKHKLRIKSLATRVANYTAEVQKLLGTVDQTRQAIMFERSQDILARAAYATKLKELEDRIEKLEFNQTGVTE